MSKNNKRIYKDGEFVGVGPKTLKNKSEFNRYMSKQYDKYKRINAQRIDEINEKNREERAKELGLTD